MADVSGLILGTIALASLFKTCIELFDYFELGRNHAYDYQLACTKIALLKARLSTWGISLRIELPGEEHPALRQHWAEEHEVIGRSLFGIKDIFGNASLLAEKYRLTPRRSRSFRSFIQHRGGEQHPIDDDTNPTKPSATSWSFLRKRTVWAIHDKQKFERFIQDLSFLIENLEKVTQRLSMPTLEKTPNLTKQCHVSGADQRALIVPQGQIRSKESQKAASHQPVKPPSRTGKHFYEDHEHLNVNELASQMNGAVFTGSQRTSGGAVVMGSVGKSDKRRNLYTGNQTAKRKGFAIMGNISDKAALQLQQPSSPDGNDVAAIEGSDRSESEDSATSTEEEVPRRDKRVMKVTTR